MFRKALEKLFSLFVSGGFLFFLAGFAPEVSFAQSGRETPTQTTGSAGGNDPNLPKLLLSDVIRQVENNHPKITGAQLERRVADAKLLEKQGAFDPVIRISSEYLRYNSTSTPGKVGTAFQNGATAEWTTRSGMKFFAGSRLNLGGVKSPLSSTGEGGEYFAGVAMPLLRDRGVNAKSIAERQARIGTDIAGTDAVATRLELIQTASESYWDWVANKKKLDINRNLFEIAKERAKQIAARVAGGDLPPIDTAEAGLEVQRRMGAVVKAERDFQKAQLKLGLYLWTPDGEPDALPAAGNAPDRFPEPLELSDFVVRGGIERALGNRPELQRLRFTRDQNELDERLARNNRKTGLDLYLAPGQDTGASAIGTTLKFGASIELPLRTREADGQLAAARLKMQKIALEQRIERQRITTEVTDAAQAVNAAHNRYLLATQELNLARDLEQGERTRFAVGDSTLFLVNQRERAAAEAEIKLVEIRAEYEAALAAFKVAAMQY